MKNLVLTILISFLFFSLTNSQELYIKITPDSITAEYNSQELHFQIESNLPNDSLTVGPSFSNLPDWINQIWILTSPSKEIVVSVEQNNDSVERSTKLFATANNLDTTWITIIQKPKETISTAIENSFEKNFEVYPNPVEKILKINSNFLCEKICLFDTSGKNLIKLENAKLPEEIDLSRFESGLYFLNFYIENKIFTKKIIKY